MRPVCVSGVVGNREIPKPTVGSAARVDNEVQRACDEVRRSTVIKRERVYHFLGLIEQKHDLFIISRRSKFDV